MLGFVIGRVIFLVMVLAVANLIIYGNTDRMKGSQKALVFIIINAIIILLFVISLPEEWHVWNCPHCSLMRHISYSRTKVIG